MKLNDANNRTPELSWYRTSPIKLSLKQIGKPPTGKGKVKRGTLIEADKEIFDRLLNIASMSMFDDDEDHLQREEDMHAAVTGRNDKNCAVVSALIPSLRGTYHCRDQILMMKDGSKHNRKVSFSECLDSEYPSIYSKSFAKIKPQLNTSAEIITEFISEQPDTTGEFLNDQRTYSGFFELLDQNSDFNANLSDQLTGAYDSNSKLFSHLDGAVSTAHSMKTDQFNTPNHNSDDSLIDIGELLQNMSKYDISPPVPYLVISHNHLPVPISVSKSLVTRMGDIVMDDADDEFAKFAMYLECVSAKRAVLTESCTSDKDDPTFTDVYILSVSDIFNTGISTENLEEKVVKKVCKYVSRRASILRIWCII